MSLNVFTPNYTTPEAMNFNLTVQREFASGTVFSLGYVGALGRHLVRPIEANPITLAGQQALSCGPEIQSGDRFEFPLPASALPTHSVYDGSIFGSMGTQSTDGTSTYNALQVSLNKGFSHGLGMLANFTWSHAIDDGSGFEDTGFQTRQSIPTDNLPA